MRWQSSVMILIATFRFVFEEVQKILPPQHEKFGGFVRGRIRRAALAVEQGDLAEQIARFHEIQRQPAAVGHAGFDVDLPAAHPEQRIARITLLEQHLAGREMVGVAKVGQPLQLVGAEVREHRIHFQNDRNFGLFAHCNACGRRFGLIKLSPLRTVP